MFKKNIDKTFFRIFSTIIIPCIILVLFIVFSLLIFKYNSKQIIKESYTYKLESIYNENELNIRNITNTIDIITANDRFAAFVKNTSPTTNEDEIKYARDILSILKNSSSYIDSVTVVNRGQKKVYTASNTIDFDTYFNINYIYNDYNADYWAQFKSPIINSTILPPSYVIDNGAKKSIIPVIYTQINKVRTSNMIIINIDIGKMLKASEEQKITSNSHFIMVNKQTGQSFTTDDFNYGTSVNTDNYLLQKISGNTQNTFNYYTPDHKKALVISYSPSVNHFGYSYGVIVPYSDINSRINSFLFILLILSVAILLITAVSIYLSTKKIYTPIDKIASLFSDNTNSADKLDFIHNSIIAVLNSNNVLNEHFSNTLPLVQEKYLIDLLNSNEDYSNNTFDECPVSFKYDYFCSLVIKLQPTSEYYEKFSNNESVFIKSGIYAIIQSVFNDKYDSYVIPCETDTLYVLLNLKDDQQREAIVKTIQDLNDLLETDYNLLRLHIGFGMIHSGIEGLKASHNEAVNSISVVRGSSSIRLMNDSVSADTTYHFSIANENLLTNMLLTGNIEKSEEFIDKLISDNSGISESNLKELYARIILVILRVMHTKNIKHNNSGISDISFIEETMSYSVKEIRTTVAHLLNIISETIKNNSNKIDIQKISEYINEHYSEDINLEQLADIFSTTPKYISKLIKEKLDITFVNYLANIRIEHAKDMLASTKKQLTEIYLECGYNNRNTFVRTFKKIVGVTPSEYRISLKK